jgi:FixJ family two-component response regulator
VPRLPIISIVDDDEAVRSALDALVRSLGYEARMFDSAEAFLEGDGLDHTDCMILDVQMPGMSGPQLQARLIEERRSIPIVFITAFQHEDLRRAVLALGAVALLGKPWEGQALVDALETALSPATGGGQ